MRASILVVDDKPNMLQLFERLLADKHDVTTASDGEEAIAKILAGTFDLVVSDLRMPGAGGLDVLRAVKQASPRTEVILMTAYATVENAVEAMKEGAYDYLTKPFDPDEAVVKMERAIELGQLRERADQLAKLVRERFSFEQMIGKSAAMQQLFSLLEKAAQFELTVLITGPSGTGKELAARAVHFASPRRDKAFVAVNCGAFPAELIESELFGHVKGAFTGATSDKRGLFEEASGGTLFLDEVGDLPLPLQVKLNRALQEREFRRVGDTRARKVDARIVAATNVDLKALMAEGRFREDLFYRLQVFPIRLPALKERPEDVVLLAAHFLERARKRSGRGPTGFLPEALKALSRYAWPGNVRELENAIERAAAVASGSEIGVDDLSPEIVHGDATTGDDTLASLPYREALELMKERATRQYLEALLRASEGNVSRAAEHAELARESLHRLLKRHHVDPDAFRS